MWPIHEAQRAASENGAPQVRGAAKAMSPTQTDGIKSRDSCPHDSDNGHAVVEVLQQVCDAS